MKIILTSACLVIITSIVGCVRPIANSRVEVFGIQGQLLDVRTKRPIKNAVIAILPEKEQYHKKQYIKTGNDGYFKAKPVYKWHKGYIKEGTTTYPTWPFTGKKYAKECRMSIIAPGYQEYVFVVFSEKATRKKNGDTTIKSPLINGDHFDIGKVYINRY